MEAYLDLASDTPMAWDTSLYRTRALRAEPVVSETGALLLRNHPLDPTPLRHRSHLALATSMLYLAIPHRFPQRLYLKYMQSTVSEIRKQIASSQFSVEDLVSGISQTLLACVLQGDAASVIAHLRAASGLVKSCGGIDAIDPNIAAVLRYSDFHFAVESLLAPVFALVVDLRAQYEGTLSALAGDLMPLAEGVMTRAKTLPPVIALVVRRFTNSALALAQAVASHGDSSLSYQELNWMASHAAGTLHILLGVYPSALSTETAPDGNLVFQQQTPLYESYTIILILWIQLLLCCANETLAPVTIRLSTLPVRSVELVGRKIEYSSSAVDAGLQKWNETVMHARGKNVDSPGDWVNMLAIVESMEVDMRVRMAPLMKQLLAQTAHLRALNSERAWGWFRKERFTGRVRSGSVKSSSMGSGAPVGGSAKTVGTPASTGVERVNGVEMGTTPTSFVGDDWEKRRSASVTLNGVVTQTADSWNLQQGEGFPPRATSTAFEEGLRAVVEGRG